MTRQCSLLCLNASKINYKSQVKSLLTSINSYVKEKLYIHIYQSSSRGDKSRVGQPSIPQLIRLSSQLYMSALTHLPSVDVTILQQYHNQPIKLSTPINKILLERSKTTLQDFINHRFDIPNAEILEYEVPAIHESTKEDVIEQDDGGLYTPRDYCALGGTFDNIHVGHKVLLSTATALTRKALTVGITAESMNKKKTLCELIQPIESRMSDVRRFLEDTNGSIAYDIVELEDPFGPTITDPQLQCLVVSEETVKGGEAINKRRKEKGYPLMEIVAIPLLDEPEHLDHQETKVSSSNIRQQKLGELLKPPQPRPELSSRPYLIGLTGGIACGKSSVGKTLEKLGAGLIQSDLLAHKAYEKGQTAYNRIIDTFGFDVIDPETGDVVRAKLGAKVFSDKAELDKLNNIVWPATEELVHKKVKDLHSKGKEVIFIEAALLLEAGWQHRLHEIWCCVVPEDEAVQRLQGRKIGAEDAKKRILSQSTNKYRVDNSNVVVCTLWDYSVTAQQVEKAWRLLQDRIAP